MEQLEKGWYWIEQDDVCYPAFFDGEGWVHKKNNKEHKVKEPIPFNCPTGCSCTTNSDGTVNVHCT